MQINIAEYDKDLDKDTSITITLGNAIRKTTATHLLDEAKADFIKRLPQIDDVNTLTQGIACRPSEVAEWFKFWFGRFIVGSQFSLFENQESEKCSSLSELKTPKDEKK